MDKNNVCKENGLYYYNTNEFATVQLSLAFRIDKDIKEIIKARLLSRYLIRTTKNYKSFKEIRDRLRYFYNMKVHVSQSYVGCENLLSFKISMISPRIIGEEYIKQAISFAREILLEPNFIDGKLDGDVINQVKKDLISDVENNVSNPNKVRKRLFFNSINPTSNIALNNIVDVSMLKEVIFSITDEDLINFYKKTINNFYRGYVFGDVNREERDVIASCFPFQSSEKILDYRELFDVSEGESESIHDTEQSELFVLYRFNDFSSDKTHFYQVLSRMLGGTNGLCHKVLRSELGLVYSAGAYVNKYRMYGLFYLYAMISEENKDKCLNGINDIFRHLRDKEVVSELLQYAKDKITEEYSLCSEDVLSVIDDFDCYVFGTYPDKEELYKKIIAITSEDIIGEVDNMCKKYVFFGRGVRK